MNLFRIKPTAALLAALVLGVSPYALAQTSAEASDGPIASLTYLEVGSSTLSSPPAGWTFGSQEGGADTLAQTPVPAATTGTTTSLKGSYPVAPISGGQYIWANYSVASLNTEDVYIEFWAMMPGAMGGCKFLKIFGQRPTSTNYADMTMPTDYTGADPGGILGMYFGDGTSITNDSQNVLYFDGSELQWIGQSYGLAVLQTPQMAHFTSGSWGASWHHFRIHVKFNSGTTAQNQTNDGEIYVEIDGKVYVNATGLYNRNPANAPIDYIQFFGWAQNDGSAFSVYYDDIRVTTGGFEATQLPEPPGNVVVQ